MSGNSWMTTKAHLEQLACSASPSCAGIQAIGSGFRAEGPALRAKVFLPFVQSDRVGAYRNRNEP